jgi:hypothetical protein
MAVAALTMGSALTLYMAQPTKAQAQAPGITRNELQRHDMSIPRDVELGLGERRLVLSQDTLCLVESGLKLAGVDLEQHFALANEGALLVDLTQDVAHDLRPDIGVDVAVERADPLLGDRHVLLNDRPDFDRGRRGRRRLLLGAREANEPGEKESGDFSRKEVDLPGLPR